MKSRKTVNHFYILLLIIVGIISSVRAVQSQKQDLQIAPVKSSAIDYNTRAKESPDYLIELSHPLSITHFEPLLLFALGTVLLSIVTGVNIFRARKVSFQVNSASQASPRNHQKLRPQGSRAKNNGAA
jgi:hypothetical protein